MADLLGIKQSVYSRKELGVISITLDEATKIAKYFNMSIDDIFFM